MYDEALIAKKELLAMLRKRDDQKFEIRARLAKRDLDYAESGCAARVVVDCVRTTDGRTLVVETRGHRCIAPRFREKMKYEV